jgi:8-oxo-dGTP pyrophosphatase MutT (NUDIX family)
VPKHFIHRYLLSLQPSIKSTGNRSVNAKPAGVLIPLLQQDWGWELLLTRRAAHLRHHPAQVAFPGGKPEPEDINLAQTALRETHEELGIAPEYVQIISQLPDLDTLTGFVITPYVGLLSAGYQLKPNPREVAEILPLPLKPFLNPNNYHKMSVKVGKARHNVHFIQQEGILVWGATARMLYHLAELDLDV